MPYRESTRDTSSDSKRADKALVSKSQLDSARRIAGGEPCWTADGKRLVYALTAVAPEQSYLESLDLSTGETKVLCAGGRRLDISAVDGRILMQRLVGANMEIWIVDEDGQNEKRVLENVSGLHGHPTATSVRM